MPTNSDFEKKKYIQYILASEEKEFVTNQDPLQKALSPREIDKHRISSSKELSFKFLVEFRV